MKRVQAVCKNIRSTWKPLESELCLKKQYIIAIMNVWLVNIVWHLLGSERGKRVLIAIFRWIQCNFTIYILYMCATHCVGMNMMYMKNVMSSFLNKHYLTVCIEWKSLLFFSLFTFYMLYVYRQQFQHVSKITVEQLNHTLYNRKLFSLNEQKWHFFPRSYSFIHPQIVKWIWIYPRRNS